MCSKNFIKRVLPFFLTFAVGLFVASFFITIAAPNFRFPLRGSCYQRQQHQQQDQMMQMEIERLKRENSILKSEAAIKEDMSSLSDLSDAVPAPPMPPMPPPAPLKNFRR